MLGWFKLNCDAAVNSQQCMGSSFGVVIRNHEDLVVLPGADIDVYSDDVHVAEAEALHFGLGLTKRGWLVSDSLLVIKLDSLYVSLLIQG